MAIELIKKKEGGLAEPAKSVSHKFNQYLGQVGASSKAQQLAGFLDSSNNNVGVLIIDRDFDSMYIPPEALSKDVALSRFTGGVAVLNVNSIMKIKGNAMPLGISLMHELGHSAQYISKPQWFYNKYKLAINNNQEAKLLIENDNVTRYEKPICRELGLSYRDKYD